MMKYLVAVLFYESALRTTSCVCCACVRVSVCDKMLTVVCDNGVYGVKVVQSIHCLSQVCHWVISRKCVLGIYTDARV